jgi:SAM-dependent methyltransferase
MEGGVSTAAFYDALAPFYHLNYADWEAGIQRQAAALDAVLRSRGGLLPPADLLDAACGIGTQSLGLAALGYRVSGSDLSAEAIERARGEAAERTLPIEFSVADMRSVDVHHGREFDAVLACDNALPHLLDDGEILVALRAFHRCTRPGGLCLVSVRDYASDVREGVQALTPVVHPVDGGRSIVFQVWEFSGQVYETSLYLVDDRHDAEPHVRVLRARYFAVTLRVLQRLMEAAGFVDVERLDEPFYQPLLVGRRAAG